MKRLWNYNKLFVFFTLFSFDKIIDNMLAFTSLVLTELPEIGDPFIDDDEEDFDDFNSSRMKIILDDPLKNEVNTNNNDGSPTLPELMDPFESVACLLHQTILLLVKVATFIFTIYVRLIDVIADYITFKLKSVPNPISLIKFGLNNKILLMKIVIWGWFTYVFVYALTIMMLVYYIDEEYKFSFSRLLSLSFIILLGSYNGGIAIIQLKQNFRNVENKF